MAQQRLDPAPGATAGRDPNQPAFVTYGLGGGIVIGAAAMLLYRRRKPVPVREK